MGVNRQIKTLAALLGVTVAEAYEFRREVSDIVVERYLSGMKGLAISGHPRSYGVPVGLLAVAIRSFQKYRITATPEQVAVKLKYWAEEKLNQLGRTAFRKGRLKTPDTRTIPQGHISVVSGGLVGVGGKHSRRSKGKKRV